MLRSAREPVLSSTEVASGPEKQKAESRQLIQQGIAATERILESLEAVRQKLKTVEPEQDALDKAIQNLNYAATNASPYAKEALIHSVGSAPPPPS